VSWFSTLARRILPKPPPQRPDNSVSRREFLSGGFFSAFARELAGPPPASVPTLRTAIVPVLRPPGALAETAFLAGCTRCGDCITACPHHAIILAPERLRSASGTPIIDPAQQPCLMCPDTPCITACTPGVLRRTPDSPVPAIGLARISPVDCLAHQGSTCTTCSERCPVAGAIVLTNHRPQVVAEACTGCGICHYVCPAPRNAILLMPRTRT
jgi:ferredoxin-type protein NapG